MEREGFFHSLSDEFIYYIISLCYCVCRVGPELGFEDPNLTALVSENLEKMMKRRQVP